nr:MAG: capsid protein [Tombusviridae sp.]QYV43035.1 MAG: capsid protein [Tombusviridae sp.]
MARARQPARRAPVRRRAVTAKRPITRATTRRPVPGVKNRRNVVSVVKGDGSTLHVRGQERAYVVSSQANNEQLNTGNRCNFWPGNSGMPRLDRYGAMFDQYKVNRMTVHYYTASGTTTAGMQLTAIDYDASEIPTTVSHLQVCQPKTRGPVWQEGNFSPSVNRLNKSKWMFTGANSKAGTTGFGPAGTVLTSAPSSPTTVSYGEVWISYDVTFCSPAQSSPQESQYYSVDMDYGRNIGDLEGALWHSASTTKDTPLQVVGPLPTALNPLTVTAKTDGWYSVMVTGPVNILRDAWHRTIAGIYAYTADQLKKGVKIAFLNDIWNRETGAPATSSNPMIGFKLKMKIGDTLNLPTMSFNPNDYVNGLGNLINPSLAYLLTRMTNTEAAQHLSEPTIGSIAEEFENSLRFNNITGPSIPSTASPVIDIAEVEQPETYDLSFSDCHLRINLLTGKWFPIDVLGVNIGNIGYHIDPEELIGLKFRDDGQVYVVVDNVDTLLHANKFIE